MSGTARYGEYVKPALLSRLHAVGLDVEYHRGRGDRLWYTDADGREIEVLDMVGGFGASLLGHNPPEILAVARRLLDDERPFHAQASARGEAGRLAERLSERVGRATGRSYVVTLANSGAEAIEAALKHAELERRERMGRLLRDLGGRHDEIRRRLSEQTASLAPTLFTEAARWFDVEAIPTLSELFLRVSRQVLAHADRRPVFLALDGAFHGKTTGAVQLTHAAAFRASWSRIGPSSAFVPIGDVDALADVVARNTTRWLDLEIDPAGVVRLVERSLVHIGAAFVEPVQGEGGVRAVPDDFLRALRQAADDGGFPLVIDEIQTGMGRTGTFLASEPSGVRGDYYTLAKTLGAGLAKISALLVDRARYVDTFGLAHTSTYAEDHHASAIANAGLDLIERDGAVIAACREKGAWLLERLLDLQARFPGQVAGVRGRGLMLGFELAPQPRSDSPLLRVLTEQEGLGQFMAGYLLNEEQIRVLTTLSAPWTLRIQPSAFIAVPDLERLCAALERMVVALRDGDVLRLARFAAGRGGVDLPPADAAIRPWRPMEPVPPGRPHVGFLCHFLDPSGLRRWEPALSALSDGECARFLDRIRGALDPFIVGRDTFRSVTGHEVAVTFLGLPFTPQQAIDSVRADDGWVLDLVDQALEQARRLGCGIVGFGGYTSIVTRSCRTVVSPDLSVTSGNSLTAAAAVEAARQAAERLGLERIRMGVVGAAGNLGMVLAEVASDLASEIVLVGRAGAAPRLGRVRSRLYDAALARAASGCTDGLARAVAARFGAPSGVDPALDDVGLVRITSDMGALRSCDLILTATNAPEPILLPEHVGDGPVVIVDVAVPADVSPAVLSERPEAVVLRGGLLRAPSGQALSIDSMALDDGALYGCLAETLLLGLAGIREDYSCGHLQAARVRAILAVALEHGFEIHENPRTL